MKKLSVIISVVITVLLIVSNVKLDAKNICPMRFTITLAQDVNKNYIDDLRIVLNAGATPVAGRPRTYQVTIRDNHRHREDYLLLFNNLPAVAMVDGRPVTRVPEEPPAQSVGSAIAMVPENKTDFTPPPEDEYVRGELLVKMRSDAPPGMWDRLRRVYHLEVISYLEFIEVYHVRIPQGFSTKTYEKIVAMSPYIEYAELNRIMRIMN
jgi:hypothetical protein